MSSSQSERRQFHRIIMHRIIEVSHLDKKTKARLLDISLKGALIENNPDWSPQQGDVIALHIKLSDDESCTVDMEVTIMHIEENHIGVITNNIDLNSAANLRRLVELNLANPALLQRELAQLVNAA